MHIIDRYFIKQPRIRRFITRLLEGDKEINISVLGTSLCVNSLKEHGYLRASRLIRNSALLRDEVPTLIHLASLFADGDTFIDIGANVGVYSLTLARLCRIQPNTKFYAFEANPDTFSRLITRTEGLSVQAYNVALSDHEGSLDFVGGAVSHVFTTIDNASAYSISSEKIRITCKRLDQFEISGDSIIIKIDVEGQEKCVLDGALDFFLKGRVKAVYLDGYKDREIEAFLVRHGFTLFEGRTLLPTQGGVFSLLALRKPEE